MADKNYDVIIVGGGMMGSSTAYYLTKEDPSLKVIVLEKDATYAKASTTLSMVNARIQFSLKENIQISQYAFEKFATFGKDMAVDGVEPNIVWQQEGNLVLYTEETKEAGLAQIKMQQDLGCNVEWWDKEKVSAAYPLYDMDEYVGAAFGPDDGHFDAYAVLMGYKNKAKSQGAEYLEAEVKTFVMDGKTVTGVETVDGEVYSAKHIVNCTGGWARELCKTAGIDIPVDPTKRQIFVLDPEVKPEGPLPLTFLPSGLYFRTETGGLILLGKSMEEDPVTLEDFSWDQKRFMEELWLELVEFVPEFEALKLVRGWAGLYAMNTEDENALIGKWPELENLYLVNGFSGHGLQQGPAVGRYVTEMILGKDHVLDLSIFDPKRVIENKPIRESGIY